MGLHLIKLLSRHDLRGKMDLGNGDGAVVHLAFEVSTDEAPPAADPLPISRPSL